MTEEFKNQVRDYVGDWEFSDILKSTIADSDYGEWAKEEAISDYDYWGVKSIEDVVPLAMNYSEEYYNDFLENYDPQDLFKKVPEAAFKVLLTWGFATHMRKSSIEHDALKKGMRAADDAYIPGEGRGHWQRTFDKVYDRESDKPVYYDEALEYIFDMYEAKENSAEVQK